jgi:hypothetical protein
MDLRLLGADPVKVIDVSGDHVFVPARFPASRMRWYKVHRQRQQVFYWSAVSLLVGLWLAAGDSPGLAAVGALLSAGGLAGLLALLVAHLALRPYLREPRVRMVLSPEVVLVTDGDPPQAATTRTIDWDVVEAVTTGTSAPPERRVLIAFRDYDPRDRVDVAGGPWAEPPTGSAELRVELDRIHAHDVTRLLAWMDRVPPGVALLAAGQTEIKDWRTLRPSIFTTALDPEGQSSASPE